MRKINRFQCNIAVDDVPESKYVHTSQKNYEVLTQKLILRRDIHGRSFYLNKRTVRLVEVYQERNHSSMNTIIQDAEKFSLMDVYATDGRHYVLSIQIQFMTQIGLHIVVYSLDVNVGKEGRVNIFNILSVIMILSLFSSYLEETGARYIRRSLILLVSVGLIMMMIQVYLKIISY
jgi:hypothetical protein